MELTDNDKQRITKSEIEYLEEIDKAITCAAIRVERTRLRRYIRNWVTELIRQEKNKTQGLREPRKV